MDNFFNVENIETPDCQSVRFLLDERGIYNAVQSWFW